MKTNYNRIIPVIAAIAIQLCLGTAYIWSVFQNGIAGSIFSKSSNPNASAALTYSILLALLTVGSTLGGIIQNKIGARNTIIIGGVVLSIGFFLASYATVNAPWVLWLTYGVLGGFGMGLTYSTTIACAQKWFPDKRGIITGVIVSALGFGGVLFTPIVGAIIKTIGKDGTVSGELMSFRILSIVFILVCTIGGMFINNPPEGYKPEGWDPTKSANKNNVSLKTSEILKKPQLYLITISLMLACMGGLMMIGFAKPIAEGRGLASTATIGVFAITLSNAFGRLGWGFVADKFGCKKTILLLLCITTILSLLVNLASGYMIYVLIACIGFAYGGFLSTFPAYTAELFGTKYNATNYGIVLLGFGIGAIASSTIAGVYKDIAKNDISLMFPAFVIASFAAAAAIVFMLFVKPVKKQSDIEIADITAE